MSGDARGSLFLQEAVDHHADGQRQGRLLRLSPKWTRWSFWLLIVVISTGIAYSALASLNEYASGPAVVRVDGRIDLTAKFAGTVAAVSAQPGQRVSLGQAL